MYLIQMKDYFGDDRTVVCMTTEGAFAKAKEMWDLSLTDDDKMVEISLTIKKMELDKMGCADEYRNGKEVIRMKLKSSRMGFICDIYVSGEKIRYYGEWLGGDYIGTCEIYKSNVKSRTHKSFASALQDITGDAFLGWTTKELSQITN